MWEYHFKTCNKISPLVRASSQKYACMFMCIEERREEGEEKRREG